MATCPCNCKTNLGRAHHKRLKALHRVLIQRLKAEPEIVLQKRDHDADGAFVELARSDDAWHLAEVRNRRQFGQVGAEREYVQRFEVPECLLTLDEALTVSTITNHQWRYTVQMGKEPQNADQYWTFVVLERERLDPCD